ncbi:hypothetical protein ACFWP0_27615 [Achromobacter sp. NPDC058515]
MLRRLNELFAPGPSAPGERTVALLTGIGIKSTQFMTDLFSAPA